MREQQTRKRVALDFSAEAYQRLIGMRREVNLETNAQLIRNALRLYEWYIQHVIEGGGRLALVDKDGQFREAELSFD